MTTHTSPGLRPTGHTIHVVTITKEYMCGCIGRTCTGVYTVISLPRVAPVSMVDPFSCFGRELCSI